MQQEEKKSTANKTTLEQICDAVNKGVEKEARVVCKMCGHSSKKDTGYCEMCSNYLF